MKEIMTQEELEKYLDVSAYTLANWRKQGLRVVKIKGKNFFMADSVREFMTLNETCEYQRV